MKKILLKNIPLSLILILINMLFGNYAFSQGNTPCTAAIIGSNPTCVVTNGTSSGGGNTYQNNAANANTPSCATPGAKDVWYQFTPTTTITYTVETSANGMTDSGMEIYTSAVGCAGAFTSIGCNNNGGVGSMSKIVAVLTSGTAYFIRIWAADGNNGTFGLCIVKGSPPPPPPANDTPCLATVASVNSSPATCTVQTGGTVVGATSSTPAACGGVADDDVWFSFTANSTIMDVSLTNVAGSTTDLYHSVYAGTCGALGAAIVCSDPNNSSLTGLSIGNVYFVRVYTTTGTIGQNTTFSLCLSPTIPPATNTSCATMEPFCTATPAIFPAITNGSTAQAGNDYGCLGTQPNPTWFFLDVSAPGNLILDISAGADVDFAAWGPYANTAAALAACGAYPAPIDCSFNGSAIEQLNITGVLAGEIYVLLVTNYSGATQNITIANNGGSTASTSCALLPIELMSFFGVNEDSKNKLTWVTASELNNDFFTLEKSEDGSNFKNVTIIKGAGNSSNKLTYTSYDLNPNASITYYRLKQTDFDKVSKYSTIISVDMADYKDELTNMHPNPVTSLYNFDLLLKTGSDVEIELISYTGEVVNTQSKYVEKGKETMSIDLSELKGGIYQLKITLTKSGKVFLNKIMKN